MAYRSPDPTARGGRSYFPFTPQSHELSLYHVPPSDLAASYDPTGSYEEPSPIPATLYGPGLSSHYGESVNLVGNEDGLNQSWKPAPRQQNSFISLMSWWWIELSAALLSLASLAAIVIVLKRYDGRAAADLHLPKFLTLNGLIAIIATLNRMFLTAAIASAILQEMWLHFAEQSEKANGNAKLNDMVLFHNASYGAIGSLTSLLRFRRKRLLAYLGCLVMILSLTYNTFIQQLVGLEILPSKSATPIGNLPRSELWQHYEGVPAEQTLYPSLPLIAAIHNGILGGAVQEVPVFCPSGNCTWPLTPSLAVCGACAESTFKQTECSDSSCTYELPSGSVVELYAFQEGQLGPVNAPGFRAVSGKGYIFSTKNDLKYYLANFDIFGVPYQTLEGSLGESFPVISWECALWACVQAYRTTVNSSIQHEEITYTIDKSVVPTAEITGAVDMTFPPLPDYLDPNNQTSFELGFGGWLALQQYFPTVLNGTIGVSVGGSAYSDDFIHGIWKGSSDMNGWITNLSTIMTNYIRTTNTSSHDEYNGTSYELAIVIRWSWIALPAVLVLLSIIILLSVIVHTAFSSAHSWKGSPLVLLLFDLDPEIQRKAHGHADEPHGIEKAIGDAKAILTQSEGNLRKVLHIA